MPAATEMRFSPLQTQLAALSASGMVLFNPLFLLYVYIFVFSLMCCRVDGRNSFCFYFLLIVKKLRLCFFFQMIYAEKWSKRRKKSSIACARQTDPSRWKTFDQEKKCRSVVADDSSSFKLIQILSVRIKKKVPFSLLLLSSSSSSSV